MDPPYVPEKKGGFVNYSKTGFVKEKEQDKTNPLDQVITLDHLTNPDKK